MKKRITLIMALVMVLSFSTGVISKTVYENIKAQLRPDFVVEIDGDVKEFKNVNGERVHPILYDGTTYLPIRAIGEIMGKTVYWYEDEKRIELKDEKSDGKTTVTDADVIVDGDDKPAKEKADKEKAEKDKADKEKIDKDKTEKDKDKINAGNKTDKAEFVGEEKAKQIALKKAGLDENEVSYINVKLEKDNGIYVYDVEFRKGMTEYNADIKAEDGTILEWDVDIDD